jgi:hypothetical protein
MLLQNHCQGQIQPFEYTPLARQEYGSIFEARITETYR